MIDLNSDEYNPYYANYIGLVKSDDLIVELKRSFDETCKFYKSISEDKFGYKYADGKWTIKEVIQHLIDSERVFAYRALCFARKDQAKLPGFDQDDYLDSSNANERSKLELIEEYSSLRMSTLSLFRSFSNEMLKNKGVANNSTMSVRAAGYVIIGHEMHHNNVIKERYL